MLLVAGEALIDMLPEEREGRRLLSPTPGGSPYNVALALGRLGVPVRFLCPFSRDAFGELLARHLGASGVDLSLCPPTDALSTLGFVTLDPRDGSARYAFYTEGTAGCALGPQALPKPWPPDLAAVHLGSFSVAVEPFGSTLERLLESVPPGVLVSLDPNIRPFLVRDREAYLRRLTRMRRVAHLVKLSEEDLHWLHPGEQARGVAEDYLAEGAQLVVLTRGRAGAEAWSARWQLRVPAEPARVIDTVGAGDTFQAALLAWLHQQEALSSGGLGRLTQQAAAEMLGFASRAAAITCGRPGCDPPWARELTASPRA